MTQATATGPCNGGCGNPHSVRSVDAKKVNSSAHMRPMW